jgi:hypothetical protein
LQQRFKKVQEKMTPDPQTIKQLPLGIADFRRIMSENYYYADKTMFIPRLEMASSYLFFVRPRRFGKSLLLSMLKSYYDVNQKDRFDEFFGNLWIGSHPTPYRNRYAVSVSRLPPGADGRGRGMSDSEICA